MTQQFLTIYTTTTQFNPEFIKQSSENEISGKFEGFNHFSRKSSLDFRCVTQGAPQDFMMLNDLQQQEHIEFNFNFGHSPIKDQQANEIFNSNHQTQEQQQCSLDIKDKFNFNQNSSSGFSPEFDQSQLFPSMLQENCFKKDLDYIEPFNSSFAQRNYPFSQITVNQNQFSDSICQFQEQLANSTLRNLHQQNQKTGFITELKVEEDHIKNANLSFLIKNKKQIFSVKKTKKIGKSKEIKKNYDKNICRYLTRKTIRCFQSTEYRSQVLKYCGNNTDLYLHATEYFVRRIEQITGFRVLKEYLNIQEEDNDTVQSYKNIFKKFYKWFLKERIARYIFKGEMDDKLQYIKYKNEVMLNYADDLKDWNSNKRRQHQKKKSQIRS